MKKVTLILSIALVLIMSSCGGSNEKQNNKKGANSVKLGIYEPTTQKEFVQILDELGIKPIEGATITGFKNDADGVLNYSISSDKASSKEIVAYYKNAMKKALEGRESWKKYMETDVSLIYMKGFDLTFSFMLTSAKAQQEVVLQDSSATPENITYSLTLGDGAVSY